MINIVEISKRAERSLEKVPRQVAAKFFYWKQQVEEHGVDLFERSQAITMNRLQESSRVIAVL